MRFNCIYSGLHLSDDCTYRIERTAPNAWTLSENCAPVATYKSLHECKEHAERIAADNASPYGLRACVESLEWERDFLHRDAAEIVAHLYLSEEHNGVFFNSRMFDAFDKLYPDFPICADTLREYWAVSSYSEESDAEKVAHMLRLIRNDIADLTETTEEPKEAETMTATPAPVAYSFRVTCPATGEVLESSEVFTDRERARRRAHAVADTLGDFSNVDLQTVARDGSREVVAHEGHIHIDEPTTPDEPTEPDAPDLVDVDDLRDALNLGEYADRLNDYRGSTSYICDAVAEIADAGTSIYYSDILAFVRDHVESLAEVISEGLYDPSHSYNLYEHGQAAEYMLIERDVYDHLADALRLLAYDYIQYDLGTDAIPQELAELIDAWADDGRIERVNEITDNVREYIDRANGEEV